jgi:hypothetical protein
VGVPNGGVDTSLAQDLPHPSGEGLGGDRVVGPSEADKKGDVVRTKVSNLITISQNSRCRAEGRVFKSLYSNISPYPARSPLLLKGVQVEGHMVSVLSDEGPQPGQTAHPGK